MTRKELAQICSDGWGYMTEVQTQFPEILEFYSEDDLAQLSFKMAEILGALQDMEKEGTMGSYHPEMEVDSLTAFLVLDVWLTKMEAKYSVASLINLTLHRHLQRVKVSHPGGNA